MAIPQKTELTSEGAERWRVIVRQALSKGGDIAVLVSQFAQQAFDQRVAELDAQGIRRRMLEGAKRIHDREAARAAEHAQTDGGKQSLLADFYGVRVELPEANALAARASSPKGEAPTTKRADDLAQRAHSIPLAEPITRRDKLIVYIDEHKKKGSQAVGEMARLDIILNRGLRNQQAVIAELGGISRELYRMAQEVAREEKIVLALPSEPDHTKLTEPQPTHGAKDTVDSKASSAGAKPQSDQAPLEEEAFEEVSAFRDLTERLGALFQTAFGGVSQRASRVGGKLTQVAAPATSRATHQVSSLLERINRSISLIVQKSFRLLASLLPKPKKRRVQRPKPKP